MEDYRAAALSTAHLHKDDLEALERASEDTQMVLIRDTGYFIKLYEEVTLNVLSGYSESLKYIIRWCHAAGYRMIEFDGAADVDFRFPTYNWEGVPMTNEGYAMAGAHVCPFCRSEEVEGQAVEVGSIDAGQEVTCTACGRSWYSIYKLTGWRHIND